MRIGSLFSGIGGFDLGLSAAGLGEAAWFVEKDPFCQRVLSARFPGVPVLDDVRLVGAHNLPTVDVLTAGVPCQPASSAGSRRGKDDERWMWPEALRVVREMRPTWALFENPTGLLSLNGGARFREIIDELCSQFRAVTWVEIRAQDAGAPHRRARVWIVAGPKPLISLERPPASFRKHPRLSGQGVVKGDAYWSLPNHAEGNMGHLLWPTTTVGDGKSSGSRIGNINTKAHRGVSLTDAVCRPERVGWPGKNPPVGWRLNPDWVEGLMSFPQGWTDVPVPGRSIHKDAPSEPAEIGEWIDWPAQPGEEQRWHEPPRITDRKAGRTNRLRALGNACVPQVVEIVGNMIKSVVTFGSDE